LPVTTPANPPLVAASCAETSPPPPGFSPSADSCASLTGLHATAHLGSFDALVGVGSRHHLRRSRGDTRCSPHLIAVIAAPILGFAVTVIVALSSSHKTGDPTNRELPNYARRCSPARCDPRSHVARAISQFSHLQPRIVNDLSGEAGPARRRDPWSWSLRVHDDLHNLFCGCSISSSLAPGDRRESREKWSLRLGGQRGGRA